MAVLLLPEETLEQLRREGWPVAAGDLGENVTTRGVPYAAFVPGSSWRIGGATVRITKPCTPCDNLYALPYVGAEKGPAFVRTLLGRRGWFASVDVAGVVRAGDRIAPVVDRTTRTSGSSRQGRGLSG